MGSDQIAAIHPLICALLESLQQGGDWCATFELSLDSDKWVQVTADNVNLAYPYAEPPDSLLQRIGAAGFAQLELEEWEPDRYATFSYSEDLSTRDLARLVDRLFVLVLQCTDPEYPIDVSLERL